MNGIYPHYYVKDGQKLKVTELKELLAKHHLVQTGKKDDLVKRLLDNNVDVEDGATEELVDPDASTGGTAAPQSGPPVTAAPAAPELVPSSETSNLDATKSALGPTPAPVNDTLTPEQQARKARAERFGIPFNPDAKPNPARASQSKSESTTPALITPALAATPAAAASQPRQKASAIDSNPLGLSEEVLARRAAKFGLPEKKPEAAKPAAAVTPTPVTKKVEEKPKEEITPEMAEKIAVEEEKKRKRAEKFGTAKHAIETTTNGTNGAAEPDAKKAKV
ncbi:hypothetical protein IAR55_003906 [Kwoniella newhampshirensis]|uniref:SAP domain-containing protein n=1 Tax=Kwoniella newhampshirensis TaxID=1651941 RepID=A0AAW0YXQ8_9TREE